MVKTLTELVYMLMNTGDKPVYSKNNLLTTVLGKSTAK
jgi:glycerol kinase